VPAGSGAATTIEAKAAERRRMLVVKRILDGKLIVRKDQRLYEVVIIDEGA
jgi:hypothetical protein